MAQTNETTVCDQSAMLDITIMLMGIVGQLQVAKELAVQVQEKMADAYAGDAKEEMDMFFVSLPIHIERLTLFYSKMAEYVWTTADSFMKNDLAMCENMEG